MNTVNYKIKSVFLFVLLLFTIIPVVASENFNKVYSFQYKYGIQDQDVYVSIPSSLYDYYSSLDRIIKKDSDYGSFVTSDPFVEFADQIRTYIGNKTRKDELYANAVLTLIHQLKYEGDVNETKFPIETIVDDEGKCDSLSFLAASIMKAGGLDVVLLYFKGVYHMTVGVHLPYEPFGTWWWQQPGGFEYENKTYWIAESTPLMDWKVGDIPPLLLGETPVIIPIENVSNSSPTQVSSKIGESLNSSSISINLPSSTKLSSTSRLITVSGSIDPPQKNQTIVLYLSEDALSYKTLNTKTDLNGNYSISWNSTRNGILYIRTSWEGNNNFSGADSDLVQIFLGFSKSIVQFESSSFYYMYGFPGASSIELDNRKGIEDFLTVELNDTGLLLSGKVLVFSSGQLITITKNGESSLSLDEIVFDNRLQPLRLPDNINQITNDQFALILRNNENSTYSLDLKGLDYYDLIFEEEFAYPSSIIINASSIIQENVWYGIEAKIYDNKISAVITDEYGYPIQYVDEMKDNESDNLALLLLLTNDMSQIVAFKDMSVEPIVESSLYEINDTFSFFEIPILFLFLFVFLVVILGLVVRKKVLIE
jgi:hypothetical protein